MRFDVGKNSPFSFMCLLRIPVFQQVAQTENGSDLAFYAPPFFCTSAGRGHAVRNTQTQSIIKGISIYSRIN